MSEARQSGRAANESEPSLTVGLLTVTLTKIPSRIFNLTGGIASNAVTDVRQVRRHAKVRAQLIVASTISHT
ncbi:MAG TPA: hypothetical protein VF333_09580 [Pyrinomonadaceae bacterium]